MCEALEELMEDEMLEREKRGLEQGLRAFVQDNIEENIPKDRIIQKLMKRFELTEEKAWEYYDKFGK